MRIQMRLCGQTVHIEKGSLIRVVTDVHRELRFVLKNAKTFVSYEVRVMSCLFRVTSLILCTSNLELRTFSRRLTCRWHGELRTSFSSQMNKTC